MTKIETRTVQINYCDFCGNEDNWKFKCNGCSKEACHECEKKVYTKYTAGVHFSGHGDVRYCGECHSKLIKNPTPMFLAYKNIAILKMEQEEIYETFKMRQEELEEAVKQYVK